MNVNIKFYGKITELTHRSVDSMPIEVGTSIKTGLNLLNKKYPGLSDLLYTFFLNGRQVKDLQTLMNDNDELVLMPPFAGG